MTNLFDFIEKKAKQSEEKENMTKNDTPNIPSSATSTETTPEKKNEKKQHESRFRQQKKASEAKKSATEHKDFEGMNPEVGGILALPSEKGLTHRVTLDRFQDLFQTFMSTTLKGACEAGIALQGMRVYLIKDTLDDPIELILQEFDKQSQQEISKQCYKKSSTGYTKVKKKVKKKSKKKVKQDKKTASGSYTFADQTFAVSDDESEEDTEVEEEREEEIDGFDEDMLPAKGTMKRAIADKKIMKYIDSREKIEDCLRCMYSYIWGQCTKGLQSMVESDSEYKEFSQDFDSIWLLRKIKNIMAGVNDDKNKCVLLRGTMMVFLSLRQWEQETIYKYHKRFMTAYENVVIHGGTYCLCFDRLIEKPDLSGIEDENKILLAEEEAKKDAVEHFICICFIESSDDGRFGDIKKRLKEADNLGRHEYPRTMQAAYHLLVNTYNDQLLEEANEAFKKKERDRKRWRGANGNAFVQDGGTCTDVAGTDGKLFKGVKCYACHKTGHYADRCPDKGEVGYYLLIVGFNLLQSTFSSLILLDTCSTHCCTNNANLIKNVRMCRPSEVLTLHTNGGPCVFNQIGMFALFDLKMYLNPNSLATVLAFHEVLAMENTFIFCDSRKANSIFVVVGTKQFEFKVYGKGLYAFDYKQQKAVEYKTNPDLKTHIEPFCFLNSVNCNKEFFSRAEIEGANEATLVQRYFCWPGTDTLIRYLKWNVIKNSPVTPDDVTRRDTIYGPPIPMLEGTMVRTNPNAHEKVKRVEIPVQIAKEYKDVRLSIDIFYLNEETFFHTKSDKINYRTANHLTTRSLAGVKPLLIKVVNKYVNRGMRVVEIQCDKEFDSEEFQETFKGIHFDVHSKNEHVARIERENRTVKERCRSTVHGLPYEVLPKIFIKKLVKTVIKWLNAFPTRNGIENMSPSGIVEGAPPPDLSKKRIHFRGFAMVQTGTDNTLKSRSVLGIGLDPLNENGGYTFLSLRSGKTFTGYIWKELPISQLAIDKINEMGIKDGKKKFGKNIYMHHERVMQMDDEFDTHSEASMDTVGSDVEEPLETMTLIENGQDDDSALGDVTLTENVKGMTLNEDAVMTLNEDDTSESIGDENENVDNAVGNDENIIVEDVDEIEELELGDELETKIEDMDSEERLFGEPETNKRPIRSTRNAHPKYVHRHYSMLMAEETNPERPEIDKKQIMNMMVDCIFAQTTKIAGSAQVPMEKGIKMYGERAIAAMVKELKQLNDGAMPGKPVIGPIHPSKLSETSKKKAMNAVNLIKEKRNAEIKGRTCANGSKQRLYLKPDESVASPVASTDAIFSSFIIDAYEGREVAVCDIFGAFLHPEMPRKVEDEHVLMKFVGRAIDILIELNPEYGECVIEEKGQRVLYVEVLRSIYGCIEAALLWYEMFKKSLEKMGFVINPYDRCVANAIIDGTQCTIVWYVDDCKLSHLKREVLEKIMTDLQKMYGTFGSISYGDEHEYLGMHVKINRKEKCIEIDMKEDLEKVIKDFSEEIHANVSSPANKQLFKVNESAEKLNKEKSDEFHSTTAKLLYYMKRARPDIETAIAFLCTRVSKSDVDDWNKLKRVLGWIKATIDDKRYIGANSLAQLFTWIDASYAVHPDMRSQTGGAHSLGRGILNGSARKQKLTAKSSTEAEVIGMSDYVTYALWHRHFLEAQGYKISKSVVYQDNMSAIKMEKNGRNSCTGNSRHIHIRYFFVVDRYEKGEIEIEYCNTLEMLADYFTKPLNGKMFHKYRNVIMGYIPIESLKED